MGDLSYQAMRPEFCQCPAHPPPFFGGVRIPLANGPADLLIGKSTDQIALNENDIAHRVKKLDMHETKVLIQKIEVIILTFAGNGAQSKETVILFYRLKSLTSLNKQKGYR